MQKQSEDQKEVPIKEDMILKAPLRVELEYTDPEEARKAFMELLHDKISNSGISWSEAMPLIVRDKRYGALKTIKERKAMFEAFLGDKKLMEKRGQEEKSRKAMEAYQLLVKDPWVSSQTRWSEFQTKFAGDARFTNVEDVGLKKKIFLDHVKGMERREKAEQAEKIKKGKEQFLSILKETSEMKWDSNWISIEKIIRSKAEKIGITEEDQVAVFDVLLKQLKDEHEAQERLKKDQQKKENKAARDDFRQLLRACKNSQTPTIYPSIRWKEFLPLIEKKEEFLKLNSLDR